MTLRDLLTTIVQRRVLVLAATAIGLLIASILLLVVPPKYTSSITFYVSAQDGGSDASSAYQGSLLSEQRVKSYKELLTSERLGGDVAAALRLPPEDGPRISGATSVEVPLETSVLHVEVEGASPLQAQQIATATGTSFTQLVTSIEQPIDGAKSLPIAIRTVAPATLNNGRVFPNVGLFLAAGFILGLLGGVASALLTSVLDNKVRNDKQISQMTNAPVVGRIEFDPAMDSSPLSVAVRPSSKVAEQFRQLRTNIQYVDIDRRRKAMLFTSSQAGDGKTATVVNLGLALAYSGGRTLLLEADLRRPRLSEYLQIDRNVGLTSVLRGSIGWRDALVQPNSSNLWVLASGPLPPNPSELLGSRQMSDVVSELRDEFDIILIDVPPLLPVTDAAALLPACDGVVLVCRHGVTTQSQISHMVESVTVVGGKILGSVLTRQPASESRGYDSYLQEQHQAETTSSSLNHPDFHSRHSSQDSQRKNDSNGAGLTDRENQVRKGSRHGRQPYRAEHPDTDVIGQSPDAGIQ